MSSPHFIITSLQMSHQACQYMDSVTLCGYSELLYVFLFTDNCDYINYNCDEC